MGRLPPFIGLYPTPLMVRRMYRVDVYLRVRRAVMVDGMSIREAARTFGLHRDTVRKMTVLLRATRATGGRTRPAVPALRQVQEEPFTGVIDHILEDDLRLSQEAAPYRQAHLRAAEG